MQKGELLILMLGAGFVGMFMHFLKLKIKSQTWEGIKQYFVENAKDTLFAILATSGGVWLLWTTFDPANWQAGIGAAIGTGFSFDSMFTSGSRK